MEKTRDHKKENKAWYKANKDQIKIKQKTYKQAHKEKIKVAAKGYREVHKEEIKAWYEIHKEEYKADMKIYYQAHKEEVKTKQKAWRQANPEKRRAASERRRANKVGNVILPIRVNFEAILIEIWDNKCAYCRNHSDTWHLDHFIPLDLKGHNAEYNLVLACPGCNVRKKAKHPFLFIKEQNISFTFKPYMKFIA